MEAKEVLKLDRNEMIKKLGKRGLQTVFKQKFHQ